MLVHVSPTETDLGETICSLSFATRVRGTHLGHDLSAVCPLLIPCFHLYFVSFEMSVARFLCPTSY